jgi:hypothetical protein
MNTQTIKITNLTFNSRYFIYAEIFKHESSLKYWFIIHFSNTEDNYTLIFDTPEEAQEELKNLNEQLDGVSEEKLKEDVETT